MIEVCEETVSPCWRSRSGDWAHNLRAGTVQRFGKNRNRHKHLSTRSRLGRFLLLFRSGASPAPSRLFLLGRTRASFGHDLACDLHRTPEAHDLATVV